MHACNIEIKYCLTRIAAYNYEISMIKQAPEDTVQ